MCVRLGEVILKNFGGHLCVEFGAAVQSVRDASQGVLAALVVLLGMKSSEGVKLRCAEIFKIVDTLSDCDHAAHDPVLLIEHELSLAALR